MRKVRMSGMCREEKLQAFGSRSADMSVKEGLSWQIQRRKANDLTLLFLEGHSSFIT